MYKGVLTQLLICVASMIGYLWFYTKLKRGGQVNMRKIAGLDAIDESVGRCTELGKPVHYTFGRGELEAGILASYDVLSYTARKCAETQTDIIVSTARPDVHAITEEIMHSVYAQAGVSDAYKPNNVRFFSDLVSAYVAGIYGIFEREKPGANIMLGNLYAEATLVGEVANQMGAIQIGGASQVVQIPFLIATCDYVLLGDELFAAGAYITREPSKVAAVVVQDIGKWLVVGIILAGTVLSSVGTKTVLKLLNY